MGMADFNERVIEDFRAHGGQPTGMFEGTRMLLLHHTGAKSGTERVTPLAYLPDGDRYVVFASKAGAPDNPAWFHNLKAHPQTEIEVGARRLEVVAEELHGDERDRLYDAQKRVIPQFAEYEKQTSRQIPVVALEPAA